MRGKEINEICRSCKSERKKCESGSNGANFDGVKKNIDEKEVG